MTEKTARKIIEKLKTRYGDIETELVYKSLYELTISVVLSAQTTDKQVNKITPVLFKKYPDFTTLAGAPRADIEKIIKSVGLYKTKAKNIINLSRGIIKNHGGKIPDTMKELISLPGIGRKSASVILSFGFKKEAFPVDTHIKRIARRMGFTDSENPVIVENALAQYIPSSEWTSAHLLLIKHGREICKARSPLCPACPVKNLCEKNYVVNNIS